MEVTLNLRSNHLQENIPKQPYTISILKSIALLALMFLIQNINVIVVELFLSFSETTKVIISLAFQAGVYLFIIYLFYWRSANRLDVAKVKGVSNWYILLLAVGMAIFANITLLPLVEQLPQSPELEEAIEALTEIPIVALFYIVVMGPFFEEIIFRNIVFKGLKNKYNTAVAMIISSLLFGAFHFNIPQFITASLLGIVCGAIYLITDSVRYSIVFHMFYNFFVMVFNGLISHYNITEQIAPPYGAVVLLVLPIALLGIKKGVARYKVGVDETIIYD